MSRHPLRLLASRYAYYISSIFTILLGMSPKAKIIATFLNGTREPFVIKLRNDLRFNVRSSMDIWIVKETCLDLDYAVYGIPLRSGWTIVDIGGGIGDFASLAAQTTDTKVHVYEPFAESRALLQRNLRLNLAENVTVFPEAVGAQAGRARVDTSAPHPVMYHTLPKAGPSDQSVHVVPLSEVVRRTGAASIDFMKIDCEGSEYDILFNADDATLARIRYIALEYHDHLGPHNHRELAQFLRGKGFRVKTASNRAHDTIGFLSAENSAFPRA